MGASRLTHPVPLHFHHKGVFTFVLEKGFDFECPELGEQRSDASGGMSSLYFKVWILTLIPAFSFPSRCTQLLCGHGIAHLRSCRCETGYGVTAGGGAERECMSTLTDSIQQGKTTPHATVA
jgi:hypothetical protein